MSGNSDEAQTKPTIETVLERINLLGENLQGQISELQSDLHVVKTEGRSLRDEFQLFRGEVEIRLDRIEGMTNQTRAEMLNLRADFREWRNEAKEAPA